MTEKPIVGITAGSFDILHPGYIRLFADAKNHCDYLVVALQTDPTVDRDWKNKPIQSLNDRKEILSAIKFIDEIKVYTTEAELVTLLKEVEPHIRIIGSDHRGCGGYTGDHLEIPIHWHERSHDYSTSNLRDRIVEAGYSES